MKPEPPEIAIDPQLRDLISRLSGELEAPAHNPAPSYQDRREAAERVRGPLTAGGPMLANTRDETVPTETGDIRVRLFNPSPASPRPALVYLHGGGWMLFSLETHDRIMREFAERAGIAVVGVEYSLAPEARYPVQLGEIHSVISWLRANGAQLGVDPGRLAIGGDSAGANLAVASCLKAREAGQLSGLGAMVLFYGVYDASLDTPSYARYGGPGYVLSRDEMAEFWSCYVPTAEDYADPLVSPLRADLTGLPPAFMAITEHDVLHDENVRMAEKLRSAGVDVVATVYPGTVHSFLEAVSFAAVSSRALDDAAAWLDRQLNQP